MIPVIITADRETLKIVVASILDRLNVYGDNNESLELSIINVINQLEKQLKDSDLVCPIQKLRE